ncbi:ATPase [Bowmanella pacifica]|uniref:ATPase n=2 Tax=Bowmanella pacifica TaxID=502051 RepID=A0A917YVE7_9ALTE|nr:ATPase [Bowmanella pacifica]
MEYLIAFNANTGLMELVNELEFTQCLPDLDTHICYALDVDKQAYFQAIDALAKHGFASHKVFSDSSHVRIHPPVLDKLLRNRLRSKEQFVEKLLQRSRPGTLTLAQFPHINTELISSYLLSALLAKHLGVNILLYGAPGTGKTELARTLANFTERCLFEVHAHNVVKGELQDEFNAKHSSKQRLQYLTLIQSLLSDSQQSMLLVDECESLFSQADNQYSKDRVHRILELNTVPCIWITNHIDELEPSYIRRFKLVMEVTAPDSQCLVEMANKAFKGLSVSNDFKQQLCRIEHLSPAIISNAGYVARTIGLKRLAAESVIKEVSENTLDASGLLVQTLGYQSELAFNPALLNIKQDKALLDDIGFALKHNKPARVLLMGPPGTGKTAYAHYLTETYQRQLIRVKCSDVLSKWVGESEQNVASLFRRAQAEEKVILLDEVDSLLVSREGLSAHYEVQLVNEFLTQIESFTQPLFAATNFDSKLDKAVLRRFDFKLECDYLTAEQAIALYRQVLDIKRLSPEEEQQLRQLRHLTPGDFAILARRKLFRPKQDHRLSAITLLAEENQRKQPSTTIGFIR